MSLELILVFALLSMLISTIKSGFRKSQALLILSLFALYGLQPALSLRNFDFWLPTSAIGLTVWTWLATRDANSPPERGDRAAFFQIVALVLVVALTSYLPKDWRWFASLPVDWVTLLAVAILFSFIGWGITRTRQRGVQPGTFLVITILLAFLILKTPGLTMAFARSARQLAGQSPELASILDLNWLGFSYIAFRLLHVLRDHHSRRLAQFGLQDFVLYVFFFPTLTAGPIDRIERFIKDLSSDQEEVRRDRWKPGVIRVAKGLFKKFVLADSLALIALNVSHVELLESTAWFWGLLYVYSFRLYFDFSGYTDIAIGIGTLTGITLPENFNQPYRQTDLTAFWNRWHITLAQWFRAYVFNPLTRAMRKGSFSRYPALIILIGQGITMALIGLWHGVTWNYLIWGLWHAAGLFIHNRWLDYLRRSGSGEGLGSRLKIVRRVASGFLTFNFVSVGWIWFSFPDVESAWSVLIRLFGGSIG